MINQEISTFNFHQHPVRIETVDNEPMFCLKDVTRILGIQNNKVRRFKLNDNGVHKMYLTDNLGRQQQVTFINEPNLYRVIFRSNKAEAVKFQNWVFEQVLPQIRQTGQYNNNQNLVEQNNALKTELLKARPQWNDIVRYKNIGLSSSEVGKLINRSSSTVTAYVRTMNKLGYDVSNNPQPKQLQLNMEV